MAETSLPPSGPGTSHFPQNAARTRTRANKDETQQADLDAARAFATRILAELSAKHPELADRGMAMYLGFLQHALVQSELVRRGLERLRTPAMLKAADVAARSVADMAGALGLRSRSHPEMQEIREAMLARRAARQASR